MDFLNNKKTFLSKIDKSRKGSIDSHIVDLIDKINELDYYYSTSSCSGRIVLLKEAESGRKDEAKWIFVSHELVDYKKINEAISKIDDKKNIWFKFEPPIIHVACNKLESAQKLLDIARPLFKLSGIISTSKNIVEIRGTDRIDVPVAAVSDFNLLIKEANSKMENGWKKLHEFELNL